jgi:1D-myo-inositol 3-kinase
VNDISKGQRVQTLKAVGEPIQAIDLPQRRARVGLVCGIAMEILPETVLRMRELCELLVCDAQSLLRSRMPDGKVTLRPLGETDFGPLVSCFDFIKASEDESPYLDLETLRHKTRIILTQGPGGCTLIEEIGQTKVPVQPVEEVDSTGAGDCFLAGLAYGLVQRLELKEALSLGNRFGALAVQQVGVPDFRKLS